ncbi:uncharacterized protein LOC107265734 isoform X2 [Cephus cinctus]|nr:uncharacterized protein LOC107265734 isoform X2 [Cephus cinctus]
MILSIQPAFLCASIFSMIINMMYSASLISSLTVHYYTPPFISLEGLLNDGSYKFGINAISAEYAVHYHPTNPFLIKLKEAVMEKSATKLPRTYIEGLTRVCNNNNYAFMANDEILEELRPQLKC